MNRVGVIVVCVVIAVVAVFDRASALRAIARDHATRVAVVYTPGKGAAAEQVRAAYAESLREAGIPFEWLASTDLALIDGEQLSHTYAALIFPDTLDRRVAEDTIASVNAFAALGGAVALVGDAGSETADGSYRPGSLFAQVTGVDAFLYRRLRSDAFGEGHIDFANARAVARWDVPSGKLTDRMLSGYGYGPLRYPYARADVLANNVRIDARANASPIVSVRRVGAGTVAYLGLPLGSLRTHSDAFPMQMLIAYLERAGTLPHLVAAPDGVGALVVDIHIDSSNEFVGIPNLRRSGLLRRDVPMEFDVTAGPDLNGPGDGLGFDACGRGRSYLQTLMSYGRIGSHGGWAHNEFAAQIAAGRWGSSEMRTYIDRNDRCLASVTHEPVRSYAAPVGEHPQPTMTRVLDDLGIVGYYYTGDTGAPVERPFYGGTIVSTRSWAFPVMPLGDVASVAEMRRAHIPAPQVERWLDGVAAYAAQRRGIYLFYSHSYDFEYRSYALAMSHFLTHVAALRARDALRTTDMASAADFMDRFVQTNASFSRGADGVHVRLSNPRGLHGIAFAVPSRWFDDHDIPQGVRVSGRQGSYAILSVTSSSRDLDLVLPGSAA